MSIIDVHRRRRCKNVMMPRRLKMFRRTSLNRIYDMVMSMGRLAGGMMINCDSMLGRMQYACICVSVWCASAITAGVREGLQMRRSLNNPPKAVRCLKI